jgi:hypothetical protein
MRMGRAKTLRLHQDQFHRIAAAAYLAEFDRALALYAVTAQAVEFGVANFPSQIDVADIALARDRDLNHRGANGQAPVCCPM